MANAIAPIVIKALTKPERQKLASLERVIHTAEQSYFHVGSALREIRDGKLYRGLFDTFEAYCGDRWGMSRVHAHRCIEATSVREHLLPVGNISLDNERQVRPLTALSRDDQTKAWKIVIDRAPEVDGAKHITAKLVESVVREFRGETEPASTDDAEPSGIALDEAIGDIDEYVHSILKRLPADLHEVIAGKLRSLADDIEEGKKRVHGRQGEASA